MGHAKHICASELCLQGTLNPRTLQRRKGAAPACGASANIVGGGDAMPAQISRMAKFRRATACAGYA